MNDLFKNAHQNEARDRSATDAIVRRAIAAGFSIRVEDANGNNQTRELRHVSQILDAVGTTHATKLHIIDMTGPMARYIVGVTIQHDEDADRITRTEPCEGREDEAAAITAEPKPIVDEIAAEPKRPTARQMESAGDFPSWIDADEARIINKLFSAILKAGYQARIFDGEQTVCHWTTDRKTLQRHTAQTEQTTLHIREGRETESPVELPATLGTITLIHGNGEDVISDASWQRTSAEAETIIEALCEAASQ
jgi:hypothetical protein